MIFLMVKKSLRLGRIELLVFFQDQLLQIRKPIKERSKHNELIKQKSAMIFGRASHRHGRSYGWRCIHGETAFCINIREARSVFFWKENRTTIKHCISIAQYLNSKFQGVVHSSKGMFQWYNKCLLARPILTQSITAGNYRLIKVLFAQLEILSLRTL